MKYKGVKEMMTQKKSNRFLKLLPYLIALAVVIIVPNMIGKMFWFTVFITILAKMIAASGLRIVSLAGDMSFAMGCFMGLGAYGAAIMVTKWQFPAWAAIILAAVFAAIIAVLTGIPFARLRSIYYCMTTMFLGVFLIYVFQSFSWSGGNTGIKQIPKLFGGDVRTNLWFFIALAVVCIALMYRFEHCRIGNTLKAISQSHEVAASMGVNERFYRLLAIGVAAFFCGIAGASFALFNGSVVGSTYGMTLDLWIIMFFMVGGKDDFFGPIVGSLILGVVNEGSRSLGSYAPYLACVVLLLVAYLLPGGLASIPRTIKGLIDNAKSKKEA
ncbi:MAG: branched-chain amino acid ABC transporter permease [Parasporobacterium sp.]|nr:branched-chain amino acid ABC transporter permease [Parasporobacterium sp.]